MTVDVVLVLQRSDLARISAMRHRYVGVRLAFVDPGLLEHAARSGLTDWARYEYRRLDLGPDLQARTASEALARATLLDLRLGAERERLWGGAGGSLGWDVGLFFRALQRAAVTRALARAVGATFDEKRIGLLRPTNVQQMHFDSFVCTDLMVAQDARRFAVVDRYHDARGHRPDAYDHVLDAQALGALLARGKVTLVSHVPGCFAERGWLAEQVARAHAHSLDLPSPFWDVPLQRGPPLLVPRSSLAAEAEVADYGARAAQLIEPLVADLLPQPRAREKQVTAWAGRARWQALNFLQLRRAFARLGSAAPPQLLLADQDTGLVGPLFSVAAHAGSAITVVPRGSHVSLPLPHERRVSVVARAGQGGAPRTVDGRAVPVRTVRFGAAGPRRPLPHPTHPEPLRRLCLLMMGLDTEGLGHADAHALAELHRPLAALCQAAGVELVLRPKAGGPGMAVLASALELPAAQLTSAAQHALEDLARGCALCLAWGAPGGDIAPFLEAGSLVLQVLDERWPLHSAVCPPLFAEGVVPLLHAAAALEIVGRLIEQPQALATETARQRAGVEARGAGALEHLFETLHGPAPKRSPEHAAQAQRAAA